jgi:serine/threonine-protein kinase RsbW
MTETVHAATISAPPDDVDAVHALLSEVWDAHPAIADLERMRFETALVELMSNVIRHSGPGVVDCDLEITVTDDGLVALATDTADEVVADLGADEMPGDELAESGRGVPMIRALVDEFGYDRVGDRNRWRIARRFGTP